MAKNLTGVQAGVVHQDSVNDPSVRVIRGKNLFPQSFVHPSTCRYGEVDVLAAARCERGDVFPYRFENELDTYTMQSPLKSRVSMYTGAFKVPMEAIYPRNWRDYMYPNPSKGDDIPNDLRAMFSPNVFLTTIMGKIAATQSLDTYVRSMLLLESVFSHGSLFAKFNIHLDAFRFYDSTNEVSDDLISFDKFFDTIFVPFLKQYIYTDVSAEYPTYYVLNFDREEDPFNYYVVEDGSLALGYQRQGVSQAITFRRALELLRSGNYYLSPEEGAEELERFPLPTIQASNTSFSSLRLNIEPIIAYKLVSTHFFVNSKVDFVYTASMFRDLMQTLAYGPNAIPTYVRNGIALRYDVFSARVFTDVLLKLGTSAVDSDAMNQYYAFWFNLFSWTRSLRYGDYFTGSHVEPLAVGDVDAPVTDGSVNTIDLTKKLQLTRFLNKVNIVGSRFEDYIRALFGGSIPEAPKDVPIRLSLEKSNIEGFEVNNTGSEQASAEQNLRTTNLKLTDSRFLFEAPIEEPCWIIVTRHFDVERIYSRTCDRFAFHDDRFDDFIPDMQFVGDQDVKNTELDITRPDTPFSYNLRYMEYKNRYSYASGGFIEALPTWSFITDNQDGSMASSHISPEYIRSAPSEFDRFYKSFAGAYSLGSYFHFITYTTNVMNPYRQMIYAPEILQ